jgi:hypothetical protein
MHCSVVKIIYIKEMKSVDLKAVHNEQAVPVVVVQRYGIGL